MLTKLNDFFTLFTHEKNKDIPKQLSLEIASAVLLCEVMRADGIFSVVEQEKLKQLLSKHFSLSKTEVASIIEQALQLSEQASDFYQFTSTLNQHYSIEQRIKIVALLWQVAYADDELASIEQHIIRKIADLLHLRHDEYIATKIEAQNNIK